MVAVLTRLKTSPGQPDRMAIYLTVPTTCPAALTTCRPVAESGWEETATPFGLRAKAMRCVEFPAIATIRTRLDHSVDALYMILIVP